MKHKIQRGFCLLLVCCMLVALLPIAGAVPAPEAELTASGTVGDGGAPWRLYGDGTLIVEAGTIDMSGNRSSPWWQRRTDIRKIIFTGPIIAGPSLGALFSHLSVAYIEGLEYLDTRNTRNMSSMFANTHITSLDLSSFNTSNVTDMSLMFWGATALTSLDLSGFDTSNVIDMSRMFDTASALTSLDLSTFNTRNVTDMSEMFRGTSNLTNLNLSSFDTRNVTDMNTMFWFASNLRNLDLSSFDTGNVTDMRRMFAWATELVSLDLSNFNTSNVTNMNQMFYYTPSLRNLDVSSFNTRNVTNMYAMFAGTESLTSLDVSSWDTRNVSNMSVLFSGSGITSLDLSSWDTRNVMYMGHMFPCIAPLRQVTFGEYFHFVPEFFDMNEISGNYEHFSIRHAHLPIGDWQNVGTGTITNPQGDFVLGSRTLMAQFDGTTMADTWVRISGYDFPFDDPPVYIMPPHAVWHMYENDIMHGVSETRFAPQRSLTRAMAATIFHRLAGLPEVTFDPVFSDVSAERWYSDAIVWAAQNDIVEGIGNGLFAPRSYVTREQFTTMLHRFAMAQGYDVSVPDNFTFDDSFWDIDQVSWWAMDGMTWTVYSRLITNLDRFSFHIGSPYLRPLTPALRYEIAVILERFMLDWY